MRTVSDRFVQAITTSHKLAVRATVLPSGDQIPVLDGSVTLDLRAASRGRADVTVAARGPSDFVPDSPRSLLAPYGNEIRLERGVVYPDLTEELVSLGIFRLEEGEVVTTAGTLGVRLTTFDRSIRLIDARIEEAYQIPSGTNVITAIRDLLLGGWPEMPHAFPETSHTTPELFLQEGEDRWAFAQTMAANIGLDLYFDGDGVCIMNPVSNMTGTPAAEIVEGPEGVLVDAGRRMARTGVYNAVIARGENTDPAIPPCRGVAIDDDPSSPTYYHGDFGRKPRFYTSPFLTTDAQCADAAAAILAREIGTSQGVQFGALVLPHLEPDDLIQITRAEAGIDELNVIENLTFPLTAAGTMTGATRTNQVVAA